MANTDGAIKPSKAFWTVIVVGFGFAIFATFLLFGWKVVWTDLLRDNPHRSISHALLLPLMSIPVAIVLVFVYYFAALIVAASIAAALAAKYGKVLFWPFVSTVPIYALLIYGQNFIMPPLSWYTDMPQEMSVYSSFFFSATLTAKFFPVLIFSWLWLRR